MTTRLGKKRLAKEMKLYSESDFKFPNLILKPSESSMLKWYFLVHSLVDTPYENGEYFGKIVLPVEYPLKAPDFYFITPNGRFATNTKICTTFSGFHQETYTSTWNILTMMEGMISFMTDVNPETGIGSIITSNEEKKRYAQQSRNWNAENEEFRAINLITNNRE
jgi:ubiquitin-conjugating enzyme E2 J2